MPSRRSWVVLVALALLAGCDDPVEPVTRLEFAGAVTSATTDNPIVGAKVWLTYDAGAFGTGAQTTTSDADGRYVLIFDQGARISNCDHMAFYAEAEGYERSDIRDVTCTEVRQVQDFALTPAGA